MKLAVAVLAACGTAPQPPPPANVAALPVAVAPHAKQDGLRGFEDGQPITRASLAGWVPGTDVIEHTPDYFVIVAHGVTLPREELDSVVPAGALARIDNHQPYFPNMVVMGPGVTNPWGIEVGMTIAEATKRAPGLVCTERGTPLCGVPHSRIHFVAEHEGLIDDRGIPVVNAAGRDLRVAWWAWNGSGRPRSAYRAAVRDWRFEAGGLGPIDGMTPATPEALAALAPGLDVGRDGEHFTLSRNGQLLVRLRTLHGNFSQMDATTPALATRAGIRVGATLRELGERVPVTCSYRAREPDLATIECEHAGVRFWLGTHPMTPADRARVDAEAPVDLAAAAGLAVDTLETEIY